MNAMFIGKTGMVEAMDIHTMQNSSMKAPATNPPVFTLLRAMDRRLCFVS